MTMTASNGKLGKPGKLNVLTMVDYLGQGGGGAELIAREVAMRLDGERFDRTFCVTRWSEGDSTDSRALETIAELGSAGVKFIGLHRSSALALRAWRPLVRTLKRERVHILHAHKHGSNAWGAVIGALAGVPVFVAHEHTWSFEGQPLRRVVDRELIGRRADAFVAVSSADRRRMIEVEGVPAEKVVLIPNGVAPVPPGSGRDVRSELGIAPGDPVIGTVCVLREQKALEVLIEAAAALAPRHPGLRVLIAGDGPERQRLEAAIERHGVAGTVTMLGSRSDVPDLIGAFDLGVCCSDFEGMPLSVIEYMEAGKAVVATSVGGLPDLIENGVHGMLVPPRDPGALACALDLLLCDPDRARRLGQNAAARRRAEFDIGVTVDRIARLYEELWAASSSRSRSSVACAGAEPIERSSLAPARSSTR